MTWLPTTIGAIVESCSLNEAISLCQPFLAGLRFEGDEVVVRRLHVEVVLPHPEAAVRDVGPTCVFQK